MTSPTAEDEDGSRTRRKAAMGADAPLPPPPQSQVPDGGGFRENEPQSRAWTLQRLLGISAVVLLLLALLASLVLTRYSTFDALPTPPAGSPGEDAERELQGDEVSELDLLYRACGEGHMFSCDELFWSSPIGSEYERFGYTCGDRRPDGDGGQCHFADSRGDDLEGLLDDCLEGDLAACDDLYWFSPIDSELERIGSTCGGRSHVELLGQCGSGEGVDE